MEAVPEREAAEAPVTEAAVLLRRAAVTTCSFSGSASAHLKSITSTLDCIDRDRGILS